MDTTDHGETRAATRRRVLQALGLGGALAVIPAAPHVVGAQPEPTTTVASPKYPTNADIDLLSAAQSAELATVELYTAVLSDFDDAVWTPILTQFREHHGAYADSLSALLGRKAPNTASQTLLDAFGELAGEPPLATLAGVEKTLADTHTTLLGKLEGIGGAALIASIITAETRHATALAIAAGAAESDLIPAGGVDELATALPLDSLIEA